VKALVFHSPGVKSWTDVPMPFVQNPGDAVVKVDLTTICDSDLRILRGDVPAVAAGRVLGHEAIGTVVEIGSAVQRVAVGDRVLVSCITVCGACESCKRYHAGHCSGGGGWILGHLIDGTHAEYVRVPFADTSTFAIPDGVSDERMLMVADVLPTAYEAGVLSGTVHPDDVVAVIGAGPVGIAVIVTAKLILPKTIIAIDVDDSRLSMAKEFGADITINCNFASALNEIRRASDGVGAHVVIETVGTSEMFTLATTLVRAVGHVAAIGAHGTVATLSTDRQWNRNVRVTSGLVDAFSTPTLIRLVSSAQILANDLVTHRFAFEDMMTAYDVFDNASRHRALKVAIGGVNAN